ncbi:MAG TPA: hemagglutinin repeat-containing protein, partial [Buttiauxella sp.]
MENHQHPVRFTQRLLSYLVSALLAGQPLLPAVAAVITPQGNTGMDNAANGVPVVNIAAPNGAGMSHNQYQDYNVGKEGIILNNATGQLNQTQLGGLIQNNPNLKAGQEARSIINEVTGGNRSQLQGYTEVAGKAANLMVANPYGITCNGCGFINTPQATLTTGKPVFAADGSLQALDVRKGSITLEGQGIDASNSDALSIISRATEVNAAIHAKDLTVITGANRVNADGSVQAQQGEGVAPIVAVDTGALGGMYANRIHLLSSETGVGVNLGNLNARQGDIQLDASGKLTVKNSLASGSLTAKGQSVVLNGEHKAGSNITVNAQGDVTVNGATLASDAEMSLSSKGKLTLNGSKLTVANNLNLNASDLMQDSASHADAGRNITVTLTGRGENQGQFVAGQNLVVRAQALTNSGSLAANDNAQLNVGYLTNNGTLQSQQNLSVESETLQNNGQVISKGELDVVTQTLEQNGTLSATQRANITASNQLTNAATGQILSEDALTVTAEGLQQNGTLSGKKALTVNSNTLSSSDGARTVSQGDISLQADNANLGGQVIAHGSLSLQAKQLTARVGSQLQSDTTLALKGSDITLNGTTAAQNDVNVTADTLTHSGKSHAAAIHLHADHLANSGTLVAPELALTGNTVLNTGTLQGTNTLSLTASAITNSGLLQGDSMLDLTSDMLTNSGLIKGTQALVLSTGTLNNQLGGTLYSAQNLTLTIPTINNAGLISTDAGLLLSGDSLTNSGEINGADITATTASFTNQSGGRLFADEVLLLKGQTLDNAGTIATKNLTVDSDSVKNAGTIQGDSGLAISAKTVENQGEVLTDGLLALKTDIFTNAGNLQATALVLTVAKAFSNAGNGTVSAGKTLQVTTPSLSNFGLISSQEATFNAATLNNTGRLQGTDQLTLETTDLANQDGGVLLSGGNIALKANSLNNAGLLQGKTINLATGDGINTGNMLSEQNATLNVSRMLNNQGKILGQQGVTISATSLDNRGWLVATLVNFQGDLINSGLIQGSNSLTLEGRTLSNAAGGKLLTDGAAVVRNKNLQNQGMLQGKTLAITTDEWNNSGQAQAQDALTANVSGMLTNNGTLLGQKDLTLQAANVVNHGNLAASNLAITTTDLSNSGLLQGNAMLQLVTPAISNSASGQLISGGGLTLVLDSLENAGLLQVNDDFSLTGKQLINSGRITASDLTFNLDGVLNNQPNGHLLARDHAALNSGSLSNGGVLAGNTVAIKSHAVTSSGILQGNNGLRIDSQMIASQKGGQLLSDGSLVLRGGFATNDGAWQGKTLDFSLVNLTNTGTINGTRALTGVTSGEMTNSGQLWSQGDTTLQASRLSNSGEITASNLTLNAAELTNNGLWQGANGLTMSGNALTTGSTSRTLAGSTLAIDAGQLTTGGTLQGKTVNITAQSWKHGGSLLGLEGMSASVADTLTSTGQLLSQDGMQIGAQTLTNNGSLLSEGDMRLTGNTLENSGALQGKNLTLNQAKITNSGTVIGLQSLTLEAQQALANRMLMAAPLLELVNNSGGQLLTQGVLAVNGGNIINNGSWQGQRVLLNALQLQNGGAIQSADALTLTLSGDLTSSDSSKITANGSAALQALNLTNNGQWLAKNLTLNGLSLNNNGAISGVDGLNVMLNGTFTQQQDKTLLTAGRLTLNARSVNNLGRLQAGDLEINAGTLTNNGRLQGDNTLTANLSGALTNNTTGIIFSQKALNLTTPVLLNSGLIQGGGSTRVIAINSALNDGKLLSGADFTFNSALLTNNGWLQAEQLVLNAATVVNNGTLLADAQSTLTGNALTNNGTVQGTNLTVNYQQLTNGGTVLGNAELNVTASQVNHQSSGKLFSGGNLVLTSTGFDQLGQVVVLGNLTLNLVNAFTGKNVLAAGNTLSISSNGDLTNQTVMQGQGVNLNAGGVLTNNGQITTGAGTSTLSGSRIAMNAAGNLQAGGDVTLNSRSDISLDGFTGTSGNMTLNAVGSLVNTALLYAGNNLYLLANSIKNQRGDILAGDSLWMQRDMAGNANAEVLNTSGTIETQRGDITIKTGHLLNERDRLQTSSSSNVIASTIPGLGNATINVPVSLLPAGSYVHFSTPKDTICTGGVNTHCRVIPERSWYEPKTGYEEQKFAYEQTVVTASASGSSARILAGGDLIANATVLDNNASQILSNGNLILAGNQLSNQSWVPSTNTNYLIYSWDSNIESTDSITFSLTGRDTDAVTGGNYRAVIQAGGNVNASFTDNISNTTTTANAGGISNTISAPSLNSLSKQSISGGVQKQNLASGDSVAVDSPAWNDQLQNALQQINGGSGLDTEGGDLTHLASYSSAATSNADLGNPAVLQRTTSQASSLKYLVNDGLPQHHASEVDTSAYPLPSGQNGYFVTAIDPKSPYLVTLNPKLNGLGELDQSLFGDLHALLGIKPGDAPRETSSTYTDQNKFLGSSYFMSRLNLHPEYDYRFLGDAAFDTRYVSNTLLNQTGNRYINGIGSDLAQMQYLMDNAAQAQRSLGLQFGVALTAAQIAALDKSIIWWEAATVNGQTVMVPKVYLSPKDVTVNNGSVIAGNNVTLNGGGITNSGSTLTANNNLSLNSQNSISNLNDGLMNAGGNLQLGALGDINNIGSTMAGKTVVLESLDGSINNITLADTWSLGSGGKYGNVDMSGTTLGNTASITSFDSLSLSTGQDINITGANVSAGGNLLMNAWGDIAVTANEATHHYSQSGFRGWDATSTSSTAYQGSMITVGGRLGMQAGNDLTLEASSVNAGGNATLVAGNDLNLNAAQTRENTSKGKGETHSTGVDRTTVTSGGNLTLAAGQDINGQAAAIAAEGNVGLQAGRDVNLLAQKTSEGSSDTAKKKVDIDESVRQQGTEIASGGNTTLIAGRDVNAEAAQVTASGDIGVAAGHDINLTTATESDYAYREETRTHKGLFSKTTTHTIKEDASTREQGTLLSGDNVTLQAGHDLTVEGSAVAGDGAVSLSAKNNVDIVAATDTDSTYRLEEKHKSGLMGTGGIGIMVGSNRSRHEVNEDGTTQSQSVSTVGSTGGNLSITAGGQVHASGADLIAGNNLSASGDSVIIEPGHDKRARDETFEQKKSGLTLALSGVVGEAINQAVSAAQAAKSQSDDRLAALQATKAVLSGVQASQGIQKEQVTGDPNDGIGISLSLSTQKSHSQSHQASDAVSGSTLTAGKDLSVTATGTGNRTNSGDIGIAGSQLKATGDTTFNAQRDLLLSSAANTQLTTGKNTSSGGAVGISFGVGHGSGGLSIFASGNASKGNEKGDGTQWSETTVDSGGMVAITSGRDTTLTGAQVSGQKVVADIGRDLTLTSQQDSDRYNAKQQSVSGGASFTFGSMTASGGLSVSQDKTRSNYDSVVEQSGIYAGQGGFNIFTGNHTQLNGAVIASTATADKNSLDTGTLGFNDIHNQADYKTEHIGVSVGAGSGMTGGMAAMQAGQNLASNLLAGMNGSGHAEGTTQAAVADGNITIRNKDNQQQDVAGLSRDTEHANDTISPIFDKEKEQQRLQTVQLISDIGGQVTAIYRTQGDIDGLTAAKASGKVTAPGPDASAKERADYLDALRNTPQYESAVKLNGIGSDSQKAVQAITGVLTGLAGGNLQAAIAGGMNPYIAEQIKDATQGNVVANTLAHAVWGGIAAEMSGNQAAAGAIGAASGELATRYIAEHYYGADTDEKRANLSEQDKQQLSLLGTLAAGLA